MRICAADDASYYLGVVALESGDPEGALDTFRGVLPFYVNERRGKEVDLVYESMAMAHAALGEHGQANALHARVAQLRADDPHVSQGPSRREQPFCWRTGQRGGEI